ncbi:patatin-like protein 2 [Quercus suber]|uniref:Patatin-like protein 2 n=1 Tax=Quercus suber TaxID=58331 RepID=A0AAW0K8M3_QUESU
MRGPKYDGKYLRSLTNELLGNLTLKETLTDVIIPSFDIKLLQPVIFSTNDTMMAISQIWKEILRHNIESHDIKPMEYSKRMLVLSLGTVMKLIETLKFKRPDRIKFQAISMAKLITFNSCRPFFRSQQ